MKPITFEVTVTDEAQLLGLSFATKQHNERAGENLTREDHAKNLLLLVLNDYAREEKSHVVASIQTAIDAKQQVEKEQMLTALSIDRTHGFADK